MKKGLALIALVQIYAGVAYGDAFFDNLRDFEIKSLTSIGNKISESDRYNSGYFKDKNCGLEVEINKDGSVGGISETGDNNDKDFCLFLINKIRNTKIPSYTQLGENDKSRKLSINMRGE